MKAETAQEAGAAGISGANTNISGGFDMGSQLVAGAANSVINATKSAASKNIRKVKVTIKTNYRILSGNRKSEEGKSLSGLSDDGRCCPAPERV